MKKILCVILCAAMMLTMLSFPSFAEEEPYVIFFDDFESYKENAVIGTGTLGWSRHIKNDTTKSSGKAYKEDGNTVCRFSIETPDKNSGPELVKAIDVTNLPDLNISCRTKQQGGTTCMLLLYADGAQVASLASVNTTSWTDINVNIDFNKMTFTTSKDGKTDGAKEIKNIVDKTSVEIRLKQNISSDKFGFWDDFKITSSAKLASDFDVDKSDWFSWKVPDEKEAKGTAIDASFLLDKPAGKHGFVKTDGDKFVFEDGTEARFWGTNVVFNAALMEHDQAEILADRIARSGYNIVRLHMIDSSRTPSLFASGTTRKFNEESLDKLFYFTSLLKERGIYIYMDLLVIRKAYAADGITDVSEVDNKGWKPEAHYSSYLRMLQKEYAQMLLTRVNPYTNLTYANDPQMAMVAIVNESSLASIAISNSQTPKSEYYKRELNGLFNTWLKEKYPSDAALRSAWSESGKKGLGDGESLSDGTVEVKSDISSTGYSLQRRKDTSEFLSYTEQEFYSDMRAYLKDEVGVRCPINGSSLGGYGANQSNIYSNAKATDFVARNNYYNSNASVISNAEHIEGISTSRVYGKPYIVTEWCCSEPSRVVAESSLMMSTYARFSGWNMIKFQMWHEPTIPAEQAPINSTFVEYVHPIRTALAPATGQNFLRADIKENDVEYYYKKTYEQAIDPDNTTIKSVQNTGIYAKTGIMYEDIASSAAASDDTVLAEINAKAASHDPNVSDQIYWDTQNIVFHLKTEYTQGIAGYGKGETELDYVSFNMKNPYYTAILNSMTQDVIPSSDRLLLSVAAHCENTGREIGSDNSTITKNGTGPVLVEPVVGTVKLKLAGDYEVYALTSSGVRKEKLDTTKDSNGYTLFNLSKEDETLNYEIVKASQTAYGVIEVIEDASAGNIRVKTNGKEIDFASYDNVYPVIENDRTLVPVRAVTEALGAEVIWSGSDEKVTITIGEKTVVMQLDSDIAYVNGEAERLDAAAKYINDRVMIPLRFISETFMAKVLFTSDGNA